MSERESAQFSDSTNQILRALDGESVTRNPAFSATTNAILDAIEEGGGGSGLPEVTDADDGKVLTVVDGEWDAAEASGGDCNLFLCDGNTTKADVDAAVAAGKAVARVFPNKSGQAVMYVLGGYYNSGYYFHALTYVEGSEEGSTGGKIVLQTIRLYSNGWNNNIIYSNIPRDKASYFRVNDQGTITSQPNPGINSIYFDINPNYVLIEENTHDQFIPANRYGYGDPVTFSCVTPTKIRFMKYENSAWTYSEHTFS